MRCTWFYFLFYFFSISLCAVPNPCLKPGPSSYQSPAEPIPERGPCPICVPHVDQRDMISGRDSRDQNQQWSSSFPHGMKNNAARSTTLIWLRSVQLSVHPSLSCSFVTCHRAGVPQPPTATPPPLKSYSELIASFGRTVWALPLIWNPHIFGRLVFISPVNSAAFILKK